MSLGDADTAARRAGQCFGLGSGTRLLWGCMGAAMGTQVPKAKLDQLLQNNQSWLADCELAKHPNIPVVFSSLTPGVNRGCRAETVLEVPERRRNAPLK